MTLTQTTAGKTGNDLEARADAALQAAMPSIRGRRWAAPGSAVPSGYNRRSCLCECLVLPMTSGTCWVECRNLRRPVCDRHHSSRPRRTVALGRPKRTSMSGARPPAPRHRSNCEWPVLACAAIPASAPERLNLVGSCRLTSVHANGSYTQTFSKICQSESGPLPAIPFGGDRTTATGSLVDRPLYESTAWPVIG